MAPTRSGKQLPHAPKAVKGSRAKSPSRCRGQSDGAAVGLTLSSDKITTGVIVFQFVLSSCGSVPWTTNRSGTHPGGVIQWSSWATTAPAPTSVVLFAGAVGQPLHWHPPRWCYSLVQLAVESRTVRLFLCMPLGNRTAGLCVHCVSAPCTNAWAWSGRTLSRLAPARTIVWKKLKQACGKTPVSEVVEKVAGTSATDQLTHDTVDDSMSLGPAPVDLITADAPYSCGPKGG